MSIQPSFRWAALLAAALVPACATSPADDEPIAGYSNLPGRNAPSGVVFSGPDLQEHDSDLLSFLTGRVSGMYVDRGGFPCPSIDMRGRKSLVGPSDPVVYVDGARASNTCVLEMMSTRAVKRIEVYPMGVTSRPGYKNHPNGLILVFLDDGWRTAR